MLQYIKNIILNLKSVIRLINMSNIRNFIFTLKHESLGSTFRKVKNLFVNRKKLSYSTIHSSNQNVQSEKLYYAIEYVIRKNNKILIYGWALNPDNEIYFKSRSTNKNEEINIIRFSRPEIRRELDLPPGEARTKDGFLIVIPNNIRLSDFELVTINEQDNMWIIPFSKLDSKKTPPSDIDYWISFLLEEQNINNSKPQDFLVRPKISVITPVYNIDPTILNKAISSVKEQLYENWELCLYDDNSSNEDLLKFLKSLSQEESRIKIILGTSKIGMVGAYNQAIQMATGEWIAILDHDDMLRKNALLEVVKTINDHRNIKFIYTNEDIIDRDGMHKTPLLKSSFSLNKILESNYINHLMLIRTELGQKINWFRNAYQGAQDYDLILRLIDIIDPSEIQFIDKVLYHWRQAEGSINYQYYNKAYVIEAGRRALQDYYDRNGFKKEVILSNQVGKYKTKSRANN